ncbi:MAG: hypothetical protein ABSB87_20945 [Terriglobales bacterium]|jgi:hypothetical protein
MGATSQYAVPAASKNEQPPYKRALLSEWGSVVLFALFAGALMIYPVLRTFSKLEVSYNEGWNVYNAATADHHLPLYGQKYGWTTVNYPVLSFYVVAWLHRIGPSYLIAGRTLSLASLCVSCLLVGLIVWRFTRDYRSALFSSLFCLAIFCVAANEYIGSDEPQMFAQVFFLCGFLIYISGPPRFSRLALTALLFVLGGNIKNNLVEFPLAVLIDLAFVGRKQVLQYLSISAVLVAAAIYANTIVGGPFFLSALLSPRTYSIQKAIVQFFCNGFPAVPLAILAAMFWSARMLKDKRLRVLAIFFWTSLFLGSAFGGGVGVWVNTYFDLNLSIAMIVGIILHQIWAGQIGTSRAWLAVGAPVALLLSFVPAGLAGPPLFGRAISSLAEKQNQFESEVSFLRAHPGPAFCASLLRCYEAGKPYDYDPFNSTNLIKHGKLDATPFIDRLNRGELAAVQLCCSIDFLKEDDALTQLVIPQVLSALETSYELGLAHEGCYIYVPKSTRGRSSGTAKIDPQSSIRERAALVTR